MASAITGRVTRVLPDLVTYMWDFPHLENSRELAARTKADCGEPRALCRAPHPYHPSQCPQTITKPAILDSNHMGKLFYKPTVFATLLCVVF